MKIEGRFCFCAFAHPHIAGEFRIPRIRRRFSGKQRLPRENLAQGSVVKIYICPVYRLGSIIVVPVAGNQIRKRIILPQYVVGDNGFQMPQPHSSHCDSTSAPVITLCPGTSAR